MTTRSGAQSSPPCGWTPDFDADEHAFYYVRVLEIPTPRYSTYDAVALGPRPRTSYGPARGDPGTGVLVADLVHAVTEPGRMPAWVPSWVPSWVRDPLVQFLLIGGALFAVYSLLNLGPDGNDPKAHRGQPGRRSSPSCSIGPMRFQFDLFDRGLDELTLAERQALVDEYVREEALYREALAMGLNQGDYIIRQRLIQRLDFLLESGIETEDVGRAELAEVLRRVQRRLLGAARLHVRPCLLQRGSVGATRELVREAKQMLTELNERGVPFSGAPGLGDRPLYFQELHRAHPGLRGEQSRPGSDLHAGPRRAVIVDVVRPHALPLRVASGPPYRAAAGSASGLGGDRGPGKRGPGEDSGRRRAPDHDRPDCRRI